MFSDNSTECRICKEAGHPFYRCPMKKNPHLESVDAVKDQHIQPGTVRTILFAMFAMNQATNKKIAPVINSLLPKHLMASMPLTYWKEDALPRTL